jgi:hypothetical protein
MTPATTHDDIRAAAALLACTAIGSRRYQALVLDGLDADRCAAIALVLARWLAVMLRGTGTDPIEFAKSAISGSIASEANEAGAGP